MYQHPYFNLFLHSNAELEPFLQSKILERKCLHEWPLSSVERLTTSSGKNWIYKSQSAPSVETAFYAQAKSPLLIKAQALEPLMPNHQHLLLEYLAFNLLKDANYGEQEWLVLGRRLITEIQTIQGDLPIYLDISSEEKWLYLFEQLMLNLETLTKQHIFQRVKAEALNRLKQMGSSQELARAFNDSGYVHGDLSGSNIFCGADSYKIIDWQRPILGPTDLDLAILLNAFGVNPAKYLAKGIVFLSYLLRIHWLTECSVKWFPEGAKTYDNAIYQLISQLK